jgi:hypothetical protein
MMASARLASTTSTALMTRMASTRAQMTSTTAQTSRLASTTTLAVDSSLTHTTEAYNPAHNPLSILSRLTHLLKNSLSSLT